MACSYKIKGKNGKTVKSFSTIPELEAYLLTKDPKFKDVKKALKAVKAKAKVEDDNFKALQAETDEVVQTVIDKEAQINELLVPDAASDAEIVNQPEVGGTVAVEMKIGTRDYRLVEEEDGTLEYYLEKDDGTLGRKLGKKKRRELEEQIEYSKRSVEFIDKLKDENSSLRALNDIYEEVKRPLIESDLPLAIKNRKEIVDLFNSRLKDLERRKTLQAQVANPTTNEQVQDNTSTGTGQDSGTDTSIPNGETTGTSTEPAGSTQSSTDGDSKPKINPYFGNPFTESGREKLVKDIKNFFTSKTSKNDKDADTQARANTALIKVIAEAIAPRLGITPEEFINQRFRAIGESTTQAAKDFAKKSNAKLKSSADTTSMSLDEAVDKINNNLLPSLDRLIKAGRVAITKAKGKAAKDAAREQVQKLVKTREHVKALRSGSDPKFSVGKLIHSTFSKFKLFDDSKIKGENRANYGWGHYFSANDYKTSNYGNIQKIIESDDFNIIESDTDFTRKLIEQLKNSDNSSVIEDINREINRIEILIDNTKNNREYDALVAEQKKLIEQKKTLDKGHPTLLKAIEKEFQREDGPFINKEIDIVRKVLQNDPNLVREYKGYENIKKAFSEIFLNAGYDGFGVSDSGGNKNYETVIFNTPKLNTKFSEGADAYRGAMIEMANNQVIILALESPNPLTLAHELFHTMFEAEGVLNEAEQNTIVEEYNKVFPDDKKTAYDPADRDLSEFMARAFELYLENKDTTKLSNPLKAILDKFAEFAKGVYNGIIKYNGGEITLTPEVEKFFDDILLSNPDTDTGTNTGSTADTETDTKSKKRAKESFKTPEEMDAEYEADREIIELRNQVMDEMISKFGGKKSFEGGDSDRAQMRKAIEKGQHLYEYALNKAMEYVSSIKDGDVTGVSLTTSERFGMALALSHVNARYDELGSKIDSGVFTDEDHSELKELEVAGRLMSQAISDGSSFAGQILSSAAAIIRTADPLTIVRRDAAQARKNGNPMTKEDFNRYVELVKKEHELHTKEIELTKKELDIEKKNKELAAKAALAKGNKNINKGTSPSIKKEVESKTDEELAADIKAALDELTNGNIKFSGPAPEPVDMSKLYASVRALAFRVTTAVDPKNLNDLFVEMKKIVPNLTDDLILDSINKVDLKNAAKGAKKQGTDKKNQIRKEAALLEKINKILSKSFEKSKSNPKKIPAKEIKQMRKFIDDLTTLALNDPELTSAKAAEIFGLLNDLQDTYDKIIIGNKIFKRVDAPLLKDVLKDFSEYLKENREEQTISRTRSKAIDKLENMLHDSFGVIDKTTPPEVVVAIRDLNSLIDQAAEQEGDLNTTNPIMDAIFQKLKAINEFDIPPIEYTEAELLKMTEQLRNYKQIRGVIDAKAEIAKIDDLIKRSEAGDLNARAKLGGVTGNKFHSKELTLIRKLLKKKRREKEVLKNKYFGVIWDGLYNNADRIYRNMVLSFDYSAIGVQAFNLGMLHPIKFGGVIADSVVASVSESQFDKQANAIISDRYYERSQRLRYPLVLLEEGGLFKGGEQLQDSMLDNIPIVKNLLRGSERAFESAINNMRYAAYRDHVVKNPGISDTELTEFVRHINTLSGASQFKSKNVEDIVTASSPYFIAARLYGSMFKSLAHVGSGGITDYTRATNAYIKGDKERATAMLKRATASTTILINTIAVNAVWSMLQTLFDDDDENDLIPFSNTELNPTNSRFLQARIGTRGTIISPMAGYAKLITQVGYKSYLNYSRNFTGKAEDQFFENQLSVMSLLGNFAKNKLGLIPSVIIKGGLDASDFMGKPLQGRDAYETAGKYAVNYIPMPITVRTGLDLFKGDNLRDPEGTKEGDLERSLGAGEAVSALILSGFGINSIDYQDMAKHTTVEYLLRDLDMKYPSAPSKGKDYKREWTKVNGQHPGHAAHYKSNFRDMLGQWIFEEIQNGVSPDKDEINAQAEVIRQGLIDYYEREWDLLVE